MQLPRNFFWASRLLNMIFLIMIWTRYFELDYNSCRFKNIKTRWLFLSHFWPLLKHIIFEAAGAVSKMELSTKPTTKAKFNRVIKSMKWIDEIWLKVELPYAQVFMQLMSKYNQPNWVFKIKVKKRTATRFG